MTKLAANLTMLFNELAFLERFEAAARAGFRGVEFLFPYAFHADQIADKLNLYQLDLVLHNLPAGKWEAGERGIACHPDRVGEFQDGVGEALKYAKVLGIKQLNCLVGIQPKDVSRELAQQTLVDNLKFAADQLKAAGIRLLMEPINTYDIPGFFLSHTRQALDLIDATGSDNLFVQYDIYHMQRMEGELANTIRANLPLIKHIQLADNPGRFEPGTGEINYRYLFRLLEELKYEGWIGCEYKPQNGTVEGLGWRAEHGL
ncbi:hydroxypyruvate isomerase [Undibacterium sp.]|jgi:hydroxypyruvate isomerase|uniref:hydroxypyruvate isomerase n=1 Tax=Undibacterium sp. TaxID=1914977 RepID=UPI002C800C86|nr:hydroxypyruvate isomerase [Undibacterium sp.]HTD04540.1 hydroxypyruvate isomerase [Undibacterium sp.]